LGLLPTLIMAGCQQETKKEPVRPVKAMKVRDQGKFEARPFPGRAKATKEVDLSFRVAGPLISRPVYVGYEVKKGFVVARIDPRDFEVKLRNAEGQLSKARAGLDLAQSDYRRVLSIKQKDPGAVSATLVDQKREAVATAQAEIKSLQATLDSAKDQLSYTYLRAPYHGTIVATYVENYETVKAKEPIVRLLDISKIEMVVDVPKSIISDVKDVKDIRVPGWNCGGGAEQSHLPGYLRETTCPAGCDRGEH
jgi:RND family efflux transporter MFP subunit